MYVKRVATVALTVAMMAGSSLTALAAQGQYIQDDYFYYEKDGAWTPAPHGHDCIESYDVVYDEEAGTKEVTMYLQESHVSMGPIEMDGWITTMEVNGEGFYDLEPGSEVTFVMDADAEYADASLSLSYEGHTTDLNDIRLYIEN